MKKLFCLLVVLIAVCTSGWADGPVISFSGEVKKGAEGFITLSIECNGVQVRDLQCDIILPHGFEFSEDSNGKTKKRYYEGQDPEYTAAINDDDNKAEKTLTGRSRRRVVFESTSGALLNDGPFLDVFIKEVNSQVAIGETATATATGSNESLGDKKITISCQGGVTAHQEDTDIPILVIENRFILDENATTVNYDSYEGDVLVKRTIKSGQWNTICLPFAMNEEQMTSAFGEGVQLADFASVTFTDKGQNSTLALRFNSVSKLAAHHPYLIQVPEDLTEFRVDGVTINYDALKKTINQTVYYNDPYYSIDDFNLFMGTYNVTTITSTKSSMPVPGVGTFDVYTLYLYLSSNKFYYLSVGNSTEFKGFRGYFQLQDLNNYINAISSANINFFVDDDAIDSIEGITINNSVEGVYDLQGRKVNDEQLKRGIYIIDGKKVVVK